MTDVTFKTGENEVTIKAEDVPKVVEKAKEFSQKVVEMKNKTVAEKNRNRFTN